MKICGSYNLLHYAVMDVVSWIYSCFLEFTGTIELNSCKSLISNVG